jgi:hypothetical protein
LAQTQGPDDPRPSLENEKTGGRMGQHEKSEIFSSHQETMNKPDKAAIAEMLKKLTRKWSGTA